MNQNGCSINSQVPWPILVDHYNICQTTAPGTWNSRLNARIADNTLLALTTVATDLDNRSDINYTTEERGILLFETALAALEKTGGRYRWLKEQENIHISKKQLEKAHQNNAVTPTPSVHAAQPVSQKNVSSIAEDSNNIDGGENFPEHAAESNFFDAPDQHHY